MAAKRIIRLNTPSRFIFMRWLFEVTVFYLLICCCWRKCACATRSSLSTHTPGPGGRHWKLGNRIAHISTKKPSCSCFIQRLILISGKHLPLRTKLNCSFLACMRRVLRCVTFARKSIIKGRISTLYVTVPVAHAHAESVNWSLMFNRFLLSPGKQCSSKYQILFHRDSDVFYFRKICLASHQPRCLRAYLQAYTRLDSQSETKIDDS